jgi:hypothetical protein
MKKIAIIATLILTTAVVFVSCDSKRKPGKIYMPDMAYSRAYETYAPQDSTLFTTDIANASHKIYYNSQPVQGTVNRGELYAYTVPNDSNGLINLSKEVKNPLPPLTKPDSLEAARLFNINCAICHGEKAGNNGPVSLKLGGVKNILTASPGYSDGRLYHILAYGQGNMGSYASQLDRKQRWMIVQYIRSLEPKVAIKTDSAVAKK